MKASEMKRISEEKGMHWFDPAVMRGFGTVIEWDSENALYFISSEQDDLGYAWNGERRYTARQFDPSTGEVEDLSEFGQFETLEEAKEFLGVA